MTKANNRETVILERRFVPAGRIVVDEGDTGHSAFLIQSGSVQVFTGAKGAEVELARLGAGQIFGEIALVFDSPRSASVKTLEDSTLIVITRQTFQDKLNNSDPTVRAIIPMLIKRITNSNNAILRRQSSVQDLMETVNTIYENISLAVPSSQKAALESDVLPKLDDLLKAVRSFQEKYVKD
ncbi:MAG: cyclic nucleotide-binding domain-containing protein [Rhodospirillales bacterium]|nr:cyclic nucleotide-binding domain-containing protein [Rhodospirillales bacterium]